MACFLYNIDNQSIIQNDYIYQMNPNPQAEHQNINDNDDIGIIFQVPPGSPCKLHYFVIMSALIFIMAVVWISNKSLSLIWAQKLQADKQTRLQEQCEQQFNNSMDLRKIIQEMKKRPVEKQLTIKPNGKFKPSSTAYFAYRLYQQPNKKEYISAQKLYYNEKYETQKYCGQQLPICIVSSGRNVVYQNRYIKYLDSLARQNYSNFKVIIIDDYSSDGSAQAIQQYLKRYQMSELNKKVSIIENKQRLYALQSRDIAITRYCEAQDIVVELDLDDEIVGRQGLSVINAVYSANSSIWVMYSSYIYWSPIFGEPSQGISIQVSSKILQSGTYRLTTEYFTSATRTFRKQLYDKIDKNDFKDQNGKYYKWTSDLFVHYSLVEMAGIEHYKYIHEIFYFYYRTHNPYKSTQKAIDRLNALSIRPYKHLQNLGQNAQRIEQWEKPQWIEQEQMKLYQKLSNL